MNEYLFKKYFIVVQVQLSAFTPTIPPHSSHPHLPPLLSPHLGFVHVSFIAVPENPSPFTPPLFPLTSPLVTDDQMDLNFNVSGYILQNYI